LCWSAQNWSASKLPSNNRESKSLYNNFLSTVFFPLSL
jgi:hypothetical protein